MSVPTPEEQVQFLTNMQRLLSEGSFVATYKYALVLTLADLALERGDDSGNSLTISTRDIAEKFVQYYWKQCRPYEGRIVLRQNTGQPAEVIRLLNQIIPTAEGSLPALMKQKKDWESLVRSVDRVVRDMPLWRLQTVGKSTLEFLYPNVGSGNSITLKTGIAFCFRKFYPLIGDLVRGAWVRYVRRFNPDVFGTTSDLHEFLFGSERANLKEVGLVLAEVQHGECFYCQRPLARRESHVDHFIPWSRYPSDLGHNFVLAHNSCNSAKSDFLAAIVHLDRWLSHIGENGGELGLAFDSRSIFHDVKTSIRIAEWSYRQTFSSQGLTWIKGREYERLAPAWDTNLMR